jgi:hypothetical protein
MISIRISKMTGNATDLVADAAAVLLQQQAQARASMIDLLRVYSSPVAFAVARRHSAERNQDAALLERNRACWASRGGNERASEGFGLPYATCTRTAPSGGWTARPFASMIVLEVGPPFMGPNCTFL